MNLSCRSWALFTLALTFVLAACSTPADLTAPTLEPQFGGSGDDVGLRVSVAPSGGVYVASREDVSGNDSYEESIVLKRFDNNGKQLWLKHIIDDYNTCGETPVALALYTDPQGNANISYNTFYCEDDYLNTAKYSSSGSRLDSKQLYVFSPGSYVAYDSKGNIFYEDSDSLNKEPIDGSAPWDSYSGAVGTVTGLAVAGNGNVYVSGSNGVARHTNAEGTLVWKIPGAATDIATAGTNTVYVLNGTTIRKLDANGKQFWSRAQSGLSSMVIADMTTDTNGNLYLAGKYGPSATRNAFTRKLNTSGGVVYTKTFGTSAYDDINGVATVTGAAIYVTGATKGALAHPYRGGDTDGYVSRLSSTGSPIWTR